MERKASAIWQGDLKTGEGKFTTKSGALSSIPYSFQTRFENQSGTNPEELIAAAHAGCFAMAVSLELSRRDISPESIETHATLDLEEKDGAWRITRSTLDTSVVAPGATQEKFDEVIESAKESCVVSKALSVEIRVKAQLKQTAEEGDELREEQAG